MLKLEVCVESVCSMVRFCSLAGCVVADYSESNQIKAN
jgi:hypothetical protein